MSNYSGLDRITTKDVFHCEMDGLPTRCHKCRIFREDRTHHCSEIGRCVRRMDHFCPWVGGVVSITSAKFFVQFISYATIFAVYALTVVAVFAAETRRLTGGIKTHWMVLLGFAGFFGLLAFLMAVASIRLAVLNLTTVEEQTGKVDGYYFALYVTPSWTLLAADRRDGATNPASPPPETPRLQTVSFPLQTTRSGPEKSSYEDVLTQQPRTFAILQVPVRKNPWNLGAWDNLAEMMGYNALDWFLPLKHSPYCKPEVSSTFKMGPALDQMKREAGMLQDGRQAGSHRVQHTSETTND